MDRSRIAVGFMTYYTGALIVTVFLLRLEMKAAHGEGAVLYYLSLSPVWDICTSIRQPPAELCAPGSTEMRVFGHRQGLCVAARACEPFKKRQKQQGASGFVLPRWPSQGTFSSKTVKSVISVYYV